MYAIEFQNVGFYYSSTDENDVRRKNYVLEGLDFAVEKGAFVALLGRNGSGKSTLARLVNGLLKPTAGKVFVFGLDTAEKSNLFEIRKKAGMIFQNPDNQQIASIVEDDIAFGPENVAMPREKIAAAIDAQSHGYGKVPEIGSCETLGRTEAKSSHCGGDCNRTRNSDYGRVYFDARS